MKQFFKVVSQGNPFTVNKQDGSQLSKCQIVLQEIGEMKFPNILREKFPTAEAVWEAILRLQLNLILLTHLLVCCSCGSTKAVTESVPIETIKEVNIHDTLVIHDVKYDSIYVSQDKYVDRSRDTLLIREQNTIYKYRLLRDTIEKVKLEVIHDSIPYEVRITEKVEVTRPPTLFDSLCRYSFFFLLGGILFLVYRFIRKFIKP